jgi:ATP-dependent Clp protease adapter protein ClpS/nucleotide-binding universal stress UspA family protein
MGKPPRTIWSRRVNSTPAFSENLQHALRRAQANAGERREDRAAPEHLLLALIDDPDAAEVMGACGVDLDKLRERVTWWLPDRKEGVAVDGAAELSADVKAILQRAVTHAISAGRDVVTGADVLVQILDESPSQFLLEQGMTQIDAKMYISHGIAKPPASAQSDGAPSHGTSPGISKESPGPADQPAMFRVLVLNDDFTPMEFVVHVLERIFDQNRETATRTMLHTHHHGRGECGVYPFAMADAKAKQVEAFAREHKHPLRCVLEPAQ